MRNTLTPALQEQIRQEAVERLRNTRTRQEKTREMATLLFFTHGVYPSAALVRDFTQHGSVTDIHADLKAFWAELREKTSVRIDAAMLPESVTGLFGEALGKVWELAVAKANESLDAERREAAAAATDAERGLAEERRVRVFAEERLATLEVELREEREKRGAAEKRVEAQGAEIEGLMVALLDSQARAEAESAARRGAEERFSGELAVERAARQRDLEILEGEVRFAKMQIEAARATERDLREQLRVEKEETAAELAAYRQRAKLADEAKGEALIELAELKGRAEEMQARINSLGKERRGPLRGSPPPRRFSRR